MKYTFIEEMNFEEYPVEKYENRLVTLMADQCVLLLLRPIVGIVAVCVSIFARNITDEMVITSSSRGDGRESFEIQLLTIASLA